MDLFHVFAMLLVLSAVGGVFNYHVLRFPTTIGLMAVALTFSMGLIVLDGLGFHLESKVQHLFGQIDFSQTVLEIFLGILLFAGALHVDLESLKKQKAIITFLASIGLIISTVITAVILYIAVQFVDLPLNFLHCMLFGALISPTDPVAVLGILKTAGAPKSIESSIAGESLFNDGVAVVMFTLLLESLSGQNFTFEHGLAFLGKEVGGGVLLGLVCGWLAFRMLKRVDQYQLEILISLALAIGTYSLALTLHLSAPIAVVVAGLLLGNSGRSLAMSHKTTEHLDTFWELIDEILNGILFVMIGLEILFIDFSLLLLVVGSVAILAVLIARATSIGICGIVIPSFKSLPRGAFSIITWGGLRGGISIALVLQLPPGEVRESLLCLTYIVVAFSIMIQGLSISRLIKRFV